jgi:HlyD family secretion protein
MNLNRRAIAVAAAAVLIGALTATYYFRLGAAPDTFQGWVEADFIFVSPDEPGRIETLSVREGSRVAVGSPLFTLDDDLQRAAVNENEAYVANAKVAYERADQLMKKQVGSVKTFDEAQAALRSAEAKLNSAKTRLDRRVRLSPVEGTVQEIYFRMGEMVDPARPIVSILPPGNVKVRFFVPQAVVPTIHIGDAVRISCDGCTPDLVARVRFISAAAEFTPPVIYSLEERARLVFRVEAIPERPDDLRIGQPADVTLLPPPSSQPELLSHAEGR